MVLFTTFEHSHDVVFKCAEGSVFKIYRFQNLPFSKSTVFKIYHFQNLPFSKSTVFKIYHFQNLPFSKSTVFKIYRFQNLPAKNVPFSCEREAYTSNFHSYQKFANTVWMQFEGSEVTIMEVTTTTIDDCAKDGGKEFFTKMHCVLITNP